LAGLGVLWVVSTAYVLALMRVASDADDAMGHEPQSHVTLLPPSSPPYDQDSPA